MNDPMKEIIDTIRKETEVMIERDEAWRILVDDLFGDFVKYLYNEEAYDIDAICYMIEKPWKYLDEWQKFLVWHANGMENE